LCLHGYPVEFVVRQPPPWYWKRTCDGNRCRVQCSMCELLSPSAHTTAPSQKRRHRLTFVVGTAQGAGSNAAKKLIDGARGAKTAVTFSRSFEATTGPLPRTSMRLLPTDSPEENGNHDLCSKQNLMTASCRADSKNTSNWPEFPARTRTR
jgi:hypothetical protein